VELVCCFVLWPVMHVCSCFRLPVVFLSHLSWLCDILLILHCRWCTCKTQSWLGVISSELPLHIHDIYPNYVYVLYINSQNFHKVTWMNIYICVCARNVCYVHIWMYGHMDIYIYKNTYTSNYIPKLFTKSNAHRTNLIPHHLFCDIRNLEEMLRKAIEEWRAEARQRQVCISALDSHDISRMCLIMVSWIFCWKMEKKRSPRDHNAAFNTTDEHSAP